MKISLENVSSGYGKVDILREIDLQIDRGEMVGVLGPNGSGKSTLLLTLSGVLPLTSGRLEIDGQSLSDLTSRGQARMMASVPQRLEAPFDLRVLSVVLMGRYPYVSFWGGYQDEDMNIAAQAMRETRTEAFADRLTGQLSGGEFQRVLIARALTQQTDILLLDEAASGLDIARKVEVYDLLQRKNQEGVTVVSVIHDLNLASIYCQRLIFLKNGRVVLDGPSDHVFTEKNLEEIYETSIMVSPHPLTGVPQAHFVPGNGMAVDSQR